jgi:hypothetical protein
MSYKHVGTAFDLVRFGCSLKVECTACGAARTMDYGDSLLNAPKLLAPISPPPGLL